MHRAAADGPDRSTPTSTVWWSRLAGAVGGLSGLAMADLAAWMVSPTGSPITAVGQVVINLLPTSLVNFGKETLGTADKPILLAIIFAFVLVVCGFAGQLEHRRRHLGGVVFGALAVLSILAVTVGSGASVTAYVPTLVGLLLGYMILNTLITRLWRWRPRRAAAGSAEIHAASPARRSFLQLTIGVGTVAALGAIAGRALASAANAVADARTKIRLPNAGKLSVPVPTGADLKIKGLSPYVTPNPDFYRIDTALQVPVIDPDTWSLRVVGMVENPIEISYADLTALPLVEHLTTLTCVSNEVGGSLIGNALWLGYPVRELLARAKPLPGADMVLSRSEDNFTAGTPLEALTDPDRLAMLAVGMNGQPLPIEHGFPVRVVVPGLYGYVSATKWVVELKVTTFAEDQGYWTPRGWSAKGPIKLASRVDTPTSSVDAGEVVVAGVAWAQHVGVSGVEVRVDDGAWQRAELADTTGPDTWRQWKYGWRATSGEHRIAVRATDTAGNLQVEAEAPPAPDGSTGYHSIKVKVR